MTRSLLVLLTTIACACLVAPAGATSGARPALKVVDTKPLTIRGTHFHARERVRVAVVANRRFVHVVRTSATGTFNTAFSDVSLADRCGNGLLVTAQGATGDTARLKLPLPECPPSLGP
jgi:hypothetical protein